ncbi:MAG: permease [Oscillospiraceae bacterium]|nr:permease [Oscillospiraceae bacterium]
MKIPVYVITGFLGEGKTTFLNKILKDSAVRTLLIQFESGEEEISFKINLSIMKIKKKDFEGEGNDIAYYIYEKLKEIKPNEIWIEWNGIVKFSVLYELFLNPSLYKACFLKKVIHIASARNFENLILKIGGAVTEQLSNCDILVIRNADKRSDFQRIKRMIHSINASSKIFKMEEDKNIYKHIFHRGNNQIERFLLGILLFILAYILFIPFLIKINIPINLILTMFLSVLLESIPFLLIGVLISSFIQIFISKETMEKRFPKKLGPGLLYAIIFGFLLPVCDCAAIPIFKSLIKKGIPIYVAITFMTASPIINPVVILSTYYAFNGDLLIVFTRLGLGIITSVLIGLAFYIFPTKEKPLSLGFDSTLCNCGCFDGTESVNTITSKIGLFLRHSQMEFFSVGKFLLIGAFASSIFQVVIKKSYFNSNSMVAVSLLIMMVLAFLFSLCSSSDAMIARSFGPIFPMSAIMGFLVFGPMIDIKNVILLSGSFSKKFILKMILIAFIICFLNVFLIGNFILGGIV